MLKPDGTPGRRGYMGPGCQEDTHIFRIEAGGSDDDKQGKSTCGSKL